MAGRSVVTVVNSRGDTMKPAIIAVIAIAALLSLGAGTMSKVSTSITRWSRFA